MDPMKVIESLGGGLPATVIVVQSIVIAYLFKLLNKAQEDKFNMMVDFAKKMSELQVSSMQSINSVTVAMEAFVEAARRSIRGDSK